MIGLLVIESMRAEAYGVKRLKLHYHSAFPLTTLAFVDDTYLIQSIRSPSPAVVDGLRCISECHDGLQRTGVELVSSKRNWYQLSHKWLGNK